ncbi:hypothetical protein [Natrarchaeobius chitinivorans]|uniref:hypothetical protein n=1 Tax=Natrarchaeobius chitinivorans TaxID=1679083 RepID=UPI000F53EAE0|nr:hypothetical protein [Natrarchaeobius chitinivorans]
MSDVAATLPVDRGLEESGQPAGGNGHQKAVSRRRRRFSSVERGQSPKNAFRTDCRHCVPEAAERRSVAPETTDSKPSHPSPSAAIRRARVTHDVD